MSEQGTTNAMNQGHGHVFPRPDGARARCGGPGMCPVCSADQVRKGLQEHDAEQRPSKDLLCGHCRLPIHPSDSRRHFGFYTAHGDGRCVQLLQMEIERLQLIIKGKTFVTESPAESCHEPEPCVSHMALKSLQPAIGRLSMAMGNPAVQWDEDSSLEAAVIDEAARRLAHEPRAHRWDGAGERCLDCGDKDWMGGSCSEPRATQPPEDG